MNEYKSLAKKKRGAFSVLLAFLIVCEVCCAIMLVFRLSSFSDSGSGNVFSLTESSRRTEVRVGYLTPDGTVAFPDQQLMHKKSPLTLNIGGWMTRGPGNMPKIGRVNYVYI